MYLKSNFASISSEINKTFEKLLKESIKKIKKDWLIFTLNTMEQKYSIYKKKSQWKNKGFKM